MCFLPEAWLVCRRQGEEFANIDALLFENEHGGITPGNIMAAAPKYIAARITVSSACRHVASSIALQVLKNRNAATDQYNYIGESDVVEGIIGGIRR